MRAAVRARMSDLFPLDEEQERFVADLLSYMTLEEKLGQLVLAAPAPGQADRDFAEAVAGGRIGGIHGITDRAQAEEWQRMAVSRTRLGLPLLFAPSHGDSANCTGISPWCAAASWDAELLERLGQDLADEARARGCQWLSGPRIGGLDMADDAQTADLIASQPRLAARLATGMLRGIQAEPGQGSSRVLACLGQPAAASPAQTGAMGVLRAAIREARAGAMAELDGRLAATLAFGGIRLAECRRIIELAGGERDWNTAQAERAMADGRLSPGEIDDAVRGVLAAKTALGLIRDPYAIFLEADPREHANPPLSASARQQLRRRAMVLLRNDRNLLPLRSEFDLILVVGPPEGAARACVEGLDTFGISVRSLPGLALRGPEGSFGEKYASDQLAIALTCDAARRSDLVLLALDQPAFTAPSDGLPKLQPALSELIEALAATQSNLVAVVCTGSPVDLGESAERLPGVLLVWDGVDDLATPLGELLTGEISPAGRLPIPVESAADSACHPFGHGLGYSEVRYADFVLEPAADRIVAWLTLHNSGEFEALETVQVYHRHELAGDSRLAEFGRIVLAPGEQRRIEIELGAEQIGTVDDNGRLAVTPGTYEIRLGKNMEIALSRAIDVSPAFARSIALGRVLRTPGIATGTEG